MFRSRVTISHSKKSHPTINHKSLQPPSSTHSQPFTTDSQHSSDDIFKHLLPPSFNKNYLHQDPQFSVGRSPYRERSNSPPRYSDLPRSPCHLHSSSGTDKESDHDNLHDQIFGRDVLENIELLNSVFPPTVFRHWTLNVCKVIKYKEHPGPLTFFDMTHKRKDGSYVQNDSREFMTAAKSEITRYKVAGTYEDSAELESRVWNELMGDDRPGPARGYGTGVTKSNVNGFRAKLRKMRNESENVKANETKMNQLRLLISKQQQQLVEQEKSVTAYMAKTNEIISKLRDEVLIYRTAFGGCTDDILTSNLQETRATTKLNNQGVCERLQNEDPQGFS